MKRTNAAATETDSVQGGRPRWCLVVAAPLIAACSAGSAARQDGIDAGHFDQPEASGPDTSTGTGSAGGASSSSGGSDSGSGIVAVPSNDADGTTNSDGMPPSGQPPTPGMDGGSTTRGGGVDAGNDRSVDASGIHVATDGSFGDGGGNPVSVYIAGDSTVSAYTLDPNDPKSWAGWGQMLAPHYSAKVTVTDDAVGGRTARRFIQEGSLDAILKVIKPGDYLLVQFGTNDSNTVSTYAIGGVTYPYFAAAATDFKTYMQQYIDGAHAKSAIPVLVTPPPRNSAYCNGPRSLADYGQAMIDLGKAGSVAVVDLGLAAHAYLAAICPKPTTAAQETFFKVTGGTIDGTHFQENGARMLATFVADGITADALGLAAYRVQ